MADDYQIYSKKPISDHLKKKYAKFLIPGEEIVLVTGVGKRYFLLKSLFILPFAFLLIGIPALTKVLRERQSLRYILTNHRFLVKKGIFTLKITSAPYDKVTHIMVEEPFIKRVIFNAGNLILITAGFDQREILIENVGNPIKFKNLMEHLILEDRRSFENSVEKKLGTEKEINDKEEEIRPLRLD